MRKIILSVLMVVIVAVPCFAQEVETDGMFSIEGTQWRARYIFPPYPLLTTNAIGFFGGKVYWYSPRGWGQMENSFYVNALVASFSIAISWENDFFVSTCAMQPAGIGVITNFGFGNLFPFLLVQIGILQKIADNWTPPGVEPPTE